jgi:hypothetical protein
VKIGLDHLNPAQGFTPLHSPCFLAFFFFFLNQESLRFFPTKAEATAVTLLTAKTKLFSPFHPEI